MFSLTLFPLHSISILCTAESTFGFLLILALKASVPSEIAQFCYTFIFSFNSILFLSGGDKNFAFLVFLLHLTRERNFIQNFYFDFQGCSIKLKFSNKHITTEMCYFLKHIFIFNVFGIMCWS